jgi:hypothetical protein
MKSWKIIAVVIAVVAIVAVAFTASAYAMMSGQLYPGMHGTNTGNTNGYYGNMMNSLSPSGIGGMMNGNGMMSGYANNQQGTDCGNHNQITNYSANGNNPISINTAVTDAQNYLATLNNPDLTIKLVEEYSNNFYVQVTEKSTGNGALELIVDKYTSSIYPEMGPNMMWNTKYQSSITGMMSDGMMSAGGMMSGYSNTVTPTTTLPVNVEQAKADAEQYLNANYPGTTTGDITTFYGYYTIEILNGTTTQGMLSVNGYNGQVWYHTWHGTFIQELNLS